MSLIIGASADATSPTFDKALSEPEVNLPLPDSAAEVQIVLSDAQIEALLTHESPLVRTFAVEQVSARDDRNLLAALAARIQDEDPLVIIEAISVLENKKYTEAAVAIEDCFMTASGTLATVCASALGQLAPERLLAAVKSRGRLDDEGFAAVATSIAIMNTDETVAFLSKALNRAGAINEERKGALYGAALLAGEPTLAGRVIGLAIADSHEEEPPQKFMPARAALAVLSGLSTPYSRQDSGLELLDHAREMLEKEVLPALPEAAQTQLKEGMKLKRAGEILLALTPLLETDLSERSKVEAEQADDEMGTMPGRRKGVLSALIKQADAIGKLDVKAAAVFVTAAAQAAIIILAHDLDEASSPAMVAVASALTETSPAELAAKSEDELAEIFGAKGDREMRRIVIAMAREHFRRGHTLERFARALFTADHGTALITAAAEVDEPHVHSALVRAATAVKVHAEATVVDMLEDRATEASALGLVLRIAENIRTERVSLILGRRFFALRDIDRSQVARTMLRCADARLLPLLKSRAFIDEAEEVAWAVLALVHNVEADDALTAAVERTLTDRNDTERAPKLRLPLGCGACGELNSYTFPRAYVDVEAKDNYGDPAFVGEMKCKACGTVDQLEPTEVAARVLTSHMLEFLEIAKSGAMGPPPLVSPAQTELRGQKMGLAKALRELGTEIEADPEAVHPRLVRARVGLILERASVATDLEVVYAQAPDSVEARALQATLLMRTDETELAMKRCAEAVRLMRRDEPVKLYDADSPERLLNTVEDYMVELELSGAAVPEDIELEQARARRQTREQALNERHQAQMQAMEDNQQLPAGPRPQAPEASGDVPKAGRNEPCPCGSGKKYKKCHGLK